MRDRPAAFELQPAEAESLCAGRWYGPRSPVRTHGLAIDSRVVAPGNIFACLVGNRADGHDFAATAVGDGAALIVATRALDLPVPVLVVAEMHAALAALARCFRQRYRGASWIAVTGSNGKTTVKDLIAAACGGDGPTHATVGNLNNHLGVPVSVLATPADRRFVVIEMGASGRGEIAALAEMVRPDVGVITGIGPAHLEGFGGLLGVAEGKSELFTRLPPDGRCLVGRYGLDEACAGQGVSCIAVIDRLRAAAGGRDLVLVGEAGCPVAGRVLDHGVELATPLGTVPLPMPGEHNLANACLAWHAAIAAGADPQHALNGLATARPGNGRLQMRRIGEHVLFDDSYNANPASMEAGLTVLSRQPGARLAVLGGMGELGADSADLHRQVGAVAARLGLALLTVGPTATEIGSGYRAAGGRDLEQAEDCATAVALLRERLRAVPHALLIKASRSVGLERVVQGLTEAMGGCSSAEEATC